MTAPVRNIDKASPVDTGKVLTANRLPTAWSCS